VAAEEAPALEEESGAPPEEAAAPATEDVPQPVEQVMPAEIVVMREEEPRRDNATYSAVAADEARSREHMAAMRPPAPMVTAIDPEGYQSSEEGDGSPARRIVPRQVNGCLIWESVLKKESLKDKYGFVQANGRLEFQQRLRMTSSSGNPQQQLQQQQLLQQQMQRQQDVEDPRFAGPDVLVVRRINEDGLLEAWNKRHPEARVKAQDRILSVNGVHSVEGMQKEIRSRRIVLQFARYPDRFRVALKKNGRRLGFRFERPTSQHLQELRISEVLPEGALPDHNTEQGSLGLWHYCVLPDMRIEATNGISGDAWEMAEELKRCETVELQIRRAEALLLTQQQVRARLNLLTAFQNSFRPGDEEDSSGSPLKALGGMSQPSSPEGRDGRPAKSALREAHGHSRVERPQGA